MQPPSTPGLKTVSLQLPASTEELRALELGTVVYLTGRVFTARDLDFSKVERE